MFNILGRLINLIKPTVNADTSNQVYSILKSIPHQRVTSTSSQSAEIIDLYQLGLFNVPNSHLTELTNGIESTYEIQENLELVELQQQSEYRPHYHKNSAAIIYIVLGSGTFQLGDVISKYHPGKHISIPVGVLHGFNTITRTLFLSIQSPPILNPENGETDLYYESEISNEKN